MALTNAITRNESKINSRLFEMPIVMGLIC